MPPAPAAAGHCRVVPQPYAAPKPRAWPQPFVPPDRRDAAAGSLHSGHSSPWPPRSPPAHGYSCRQQTITMASGLPAGTACPFPSLCSQEAACTVRVPCAGPRWHLARFDGSWGGFAMEPGRRLPPPPVALVPHAMAGAAQARGWGWCWVPPPCCRRWAPLWKRLLAQLEQVGWERGVSAPHFWPQWYCGVGTQDWDPQPGQQTPQTAAA